MKNFTKHLPHYLSLLGILCAGVAGFILFSYDRRFEVALSVFVAISYIIWGVVHHKIHKDFDLTVLIEYLAVSLLGLVIVFSLIFRV
jgi:hypothetical protein